MCRHHYRKSIGEGKRRWQAVKKDPELLRKTKLAKRAWDLSPEGKAAKREADKRYMETHREQILAYKRAWGEAERFGSLRAKVLQRDGNKCLMCGTDHDLVVHHKDETGRGEQEHNNDLSNLATFCRSCHMRHHFSKIHQARIEKISSQVL